ncbi:predicted protein [Uncinocarpus reesii 1704]|uniref:Nitrogen regulatory protein areA GATA-like domain-containing protein n=1 Tax=Uncinocarpus reesii (strain UAMH 1704) TaxID=336963 RepID=C4JI13_UNCRE|nr:uncharacterized protein UREG_01438 [Uncinocarpus reesii 1704]EEP76589.1 predicted protein [Uncinocarpus reesii 1704]
MTDSRMPPYGQPSPDLSSQPPSPQARSRRPSEKFRPVSHINTLFYCSTREAWIPSVASGPSYVAVSGVYAPSKHRLLDFEPNPIGDELALPDYDAGFHEPSKTETLQNQPADVSQPDIGRDDDGDSWFSNPMNVPKTAGDDSCLERRPTRQVDYLTHTWKQEEIRGSWKYLTRNRSCKNSWRLENAAWRSWMKTKNHLPTIAPESMGWLKDADVTWLFGPLLVDDRDYPSSTRPSSVAVPASNSQGDPKPILKKKTISQAILQHSLSTDSLLQHAGTLIRSQTEDRRLGLGRTVSDTAMLTTHNESSLQAAEVAPSVASSGTSSPNSRRHITFNQVVSQVVAVNRDDYDGDDEDDDFSGDYCLLDDDDASSLSTLVTMKGSASRPSLSSNSTPRSSFSSDTRTIIAHLPPTTLKWDSGSDTEDDETPYFGPPWDRPGLSRTFSTDTLRATFGNTGRLPSPNILSTSNPALVTVGPKHPTISPMCSGTSAGNPDPDPD